MLVLLTEVCLYISFYCIEIIGFLYTLQEWNSSNLGNEKVRLHSIWKMYMARFSEGLVLWNVHDAIIIKFNLPTNLEKKIMPYRSTLPTVRIAHFYTVL